MTPQTPTYQTQKWRLDALFSSSESPEMEAAFAELDNQIAIFETYRDALTPDITPEKLIEIIEQMAVMLNLGYRVWQFSSLSFSEDTQNQKALSFSARVRQFFAGFENRTMFFSLWWKALDDENATRLMAAAGEYRYYLQEMRNFKPHTLTESEEKIINIKDTTGSSALNTLYSTITNRYTFQLELEGEVKELTRGELMVHVHSTDPDVRAAVFQELYRVYGNDALILSQIYEALVRDWWNENVDLRKFAAPISVRNLANDVPDAAVDLLLDVCKRNAVVFQRFFKLKAKWLGMEKLRRFDVYAPVVDSDKSYDFNTAAEMVFKAFNDFHPSFAANAKKLFDEDRIDSEIRKGKSGGAFCSSSTPELTPWVLLNYQGKARDIATLAHELGHAIHSLMAAGNPIFTFHSALPMAETASTFGEMLVVDHMLAQETDEKVIVDILFKQMDDAYATIIRQAFFALFEKEAHEMVQNGASMDELNAAYLENLKTQFGDAVEIDELFQYEWVSIPHIYRTPFYVYAYAFGQLLVFALYQQYKAEGEAFKTRFMEILAAGGSASPTDILEKAGIDLSSEAFWQGGFDVIVNLVDQLEKIEIPA